jgi:hypothetical protein
MVKSDCGPFKHNPDMKNEGADNINIYRSNHRSSRQHGDIGMSTELQHVRGMIHQHLHSVYFYYCYNCVSASCTSVTIAVKPVLRGHIWDKEKVIDNCEKSMSC